MTSAGLSTPKVRWLMVISGATTVVAVAAVIGVGAWFGPQAALNVFIIAALVGAVMVVAQALAQRRGKILLRNTAVLAVNLAHVGDVGLDHAKATGQSCRSVDRPLPYAVPVLIAMAVLIASSWRS